MTERVIYYGENDLAYGYNLNRVEKIKVPTVDRMSINEAIEFVQIHKYFANGARLKEWSDTQYEGLLQKSKTLFQLSMRYFHQMNDEKLLTDYRRVDSLYLSAFWESFDHCKLYKNISDDAMRKIVFGKRIIPEVLFHYHSIVAQYGEILRSFLLRYPLNASIIVRAMKNDRAANNRELYLPKELTNKDVCDVISACIDNPDASVNTLESVYRLQSSKRYTIPDELRLKAKRQYEKKCEGMLQNGGVTSFEATIIIDSNQDEEKIIETTDNGARLSYSKKWLLDSLDYPTILNNFIYLFEYADAPQMRCNLVSKPCYSSSLERLITPNGTQDYPAYFAFRTQNNIARLQMSAYRAFLEEQGIRIETVLQWFFTEYLQSEFNCSEMRVMFPCKEATSAEKCITICAALDSVLKQFSSFVRFGDIDFDLVTISSHSVKFCDVPSLNKTKYIYGTGQTFRNLSAGLFSDQCMYSFVGRIREEGRNYNTFYELLCNEEVYLFDYPANMHTALRYLADNKVISIADDGKIALGDPWKVQILMDLYKNEVISLNHYPVVVKPIVSEWLNHGILSEKSSLFSDLEVNYFNYLLNRAEFTNGLDLRNKYIHGVQQVSTNEDEHLQNYNTLLIIFVIVAIKINDDFCIREEEKERTRRIKMEQSGEMSNK